MRKFVLLFAALCYVVMAQAWELKVDGICYNVNWSDETAVVTYETRGSDNYKNLSGAITIPSSVRGDLTDFKVVAIGDSAFVDAKKLTSVTMPNSVTNIGNNAFSYCSGLTSITIGNSVTSIGKSAFRSCKGLTSVTLPNSVKSIGTYAFYECSGLKSINIPNGVTIIRHATFGYCIALTTITIPNSVTEIDMYGFLKCASLRSLIIPSNVTRIGEEALAKCTGLNSLTCMAVTPPVCGANAFKEVEKSISLYVPAVSLEDYKSTDQWKDFTHIIQLTDGVDEVQCDMVQSTKVIRDGQVFVIRGDKTYNVLGVEYDAQR